MCANAYSTLGSTHNYRDLGVGALLKPVELDYLPLARRELAEGFVEELRALSKLEGQVFGFGCGLGFDLQGGHFTALLSPPVFADQIHCDGHDPWPKLRASTKVVAGSVESKERLLDDLFGELVRPQVPTSQPKKNWRIALE
jgi:hypothetical protein